MNLLRKSFILDKTENMSVGSIEEFIEKSGFKPLRWAVTEIKDEKFTVEAVVINY